MAAYANTEVKQPVVAEISELLNGAQAAVLADYRGLTVEQDTELRKQLREAGVVYKVYKNTMVKLAAKGTEFEALSPDLEGPTALAVSKTDAAVPAKVPSREELLGKLLGSIQSPITNMARVLNQIAEAKAEA